MSLMRGPFGRMRFGATGASGKSLLTPSDLTWLGSWRFPAYGSGSGATGGMAYSRAPLALRYSGSPSTRRFLTVTMRANGADHGYRCFGDIVEWSEPGSYYTTDRHPGTGAPAMTRLGNWANWWADNVPSNSNGVYVGALYWDETNHGVWYTVWPYYDGGTGEYPVLGFTVLGDDYTVGTKYGMWNFRDTDDSTAYRKHIQTLLVPIPSSAQSDIGHAMMGGSAVTSTLGQQGHAGVGLTGFTLPSLSLAAGGTITGHCDLMNSCAGDSPLDPCNTQRDTDYFNHGNQKTNSDEPSPAMPNPVGEVGFWCASADNFNGAVWLEGTTKHGVLLFGRQISGDCWYGLTPWTSHGLADLAYSGDGYHATDDDHYHAALYVIDPDHLRAVGRGERVPWAGAYGGKSGVAFSAIHNWNTEWPNAAESDSSHTGTPSSTAPRVSNLGSNTAVYDATTKQLFWAQPMATPWAGGGSGEPAINVFEVDL